MNNEQLRVEFEAWLESEFEKPKPSVITHAQDNGRWEGYRAAAQSRDELIGKLVKILKQIRQADTSSLFSIDFETGEESRVAGLVPKEISAQALAEAKAQGYGE